MLSVPTYYSQKLSCWLPLCSSFSNNTLSTTFMEGMANLPTMYRGRSSGSCRLLSSSPLSISTYKKFYPLYSAVLLLLWLPGLLLPLGPADQSNMTKFSTFVKLVFEINSALHHVRFYYISYMVL